MHEDKKPFIPCRRNLDYRLCQVSGVYTQFVYKGRSSTWRTSLISKHGCKSLRVLNHLEFNFVFPRRHAAYLMSINKVKCSPSSNTTKRTLLHINSFLKKENSTSSEFVNASKPCGIVTLEIAMKRFQWNSRVSSVCFWFQSILT